MKRNYTSFLTVLLMISSCITGFSQTKITSFYHTEEASLAAQEGAIRANFKDDGIKSAVLSRGAGIKYANNSTLSYVANFPTNESKSMAFTKNSYFEIAITVEEGKSLSLFALNSRLRTATESSVTNYRWRYSIDNTTETAFKEIGDADQTIGWTNPQGEEQKIGLANIPDLQSIAPGRTVYFRLYAWGAKGKNADAGFGFGKSNTAKREVLSFSGKIVNK